MLSQENLEQRNDVCFRVSQVIASFETGECIGIEDLEEIVKALGGDPENLRMSMDGFPDAIQQLTYVQLLLIQYLLEN